MTGRARCGCGRGLPPVCAEGKRLLADESRAISHLVWCMGSQGPETQAEAQERLRACRRALEDHCAAEPVTT